MEEYSEVLFEMASVRPKSLNNVKILLAVNPDMKRLGLAYFKMYDNISIDKASVVWRINFRTPELIKEHKGKISSASTINSYYRNLLIDYLNSPSKENTNYKIWDVLKYHWNDEMGLCGSYNLEDYMDGKIDSNTHKSYLPSYLDMPDYKKLN